MKKIFLLVVVLMFSFTLGCNLLSETTTQTTTPVTIETTTTSTTVDLTSIFEAEFFYLESMIPLEITADWSLPSLNDSRFTAIFFQDGETITDNVFVYTPSLDGINSVLTVELHYGEVSESQDFTILMVENETLYNQYLIDQTFFSVIDMLETSIPEEIESDLFLPSSELDGVTISYEVDASYIYNNHLIFTFPDENTLFHITTTIRYQGIVQIRVFNVIMLEFESLFQIPEIRIHTENQTVVESKEDYVAGTFSLTTYGVDEQPINLINEMNIMIRCRGNSTFYMPKKSYRVKFESKTNLLFDYYENDWVLLANFSDQTLIRNYLAHQLSADMNMEFSPAAAFVDVYINDEYLGNYMISDQIEVSNDRVDIEEHSFNANTGYLLEMDKRQYDPYLVEGTEGVDWFYVYGIPYIIKSPKTDSVYFSHQQFVFIESYIAEVHLCLMNQQDYSSLIDEDSFIDWFIIQEVFQNVDSGYSSVYMYKDRDDVLKMGPIWDFDLSTGNPGHLGDDLRQPEGWYTSLDFKNIWYYYLMQYPEFKTHLKERWNEVYDVQIRALLENVYKTANEISKSRYLNFRKWDVIGSWEDWYTATEILAADNYQKQLEFLYNYLLIRSQWLNQEINKF